MKKQSEAIEAINAYVTSIEAKTGHSPIPRPDPICGMANARTIFVHHSPNKAAVESGLISGENKDQTAPCVMELIGETGINTLDTIGWNLVPWALPDFRHPTKQDGIEGLPYLQNLFPLLEDLKVVFLFGGFVRQFKSVLMVPSGVIIIECRMPTQRVRNRFGEAGWDEIRHKFRQVAEAVK